MSWSKCYTNLALRRVMDEQHCSLWNAICFLRYGRFYWIAR